MTRTNNPIARYLIYIALALFTVYNVLPFCWTILNSIKLPKDANASTFPASSSARPAKITPTSG